MANRKLDISDEELRDEIRKQQAVYINAFKTQELFIVQAFKNPIINPVLGAHLQCICDAIAHIPDLELQQEYLAC